MIKTLQQKFIIFATNTGLRFLRFAKKSRVFALVLAGIERVIIFDRNSPRDPSWAKWQTIGAIVCFFLAATSYMLKNALNCPSTRIPDLYYCVKDFIKF